MDVLARIIERQPKPVRVCLTAELIISYNRHNYDPPVIITSDTAIVENDNIKEILSSLYESLKKNSIKDKVLSRSSITLEVIH
jgi:hypothetical protein